MGTRADIRADKAKRVRAVFCDLMNLPRGKFIRSQKTARTRFALSPLAAPIMRLQIADEPSPEAASPRR